MRKIGIYGGSFNPPHAGHLLAAKEAVRTLGLDQVLFIPAAQPPHKALAEGSPDAETRLELVRRAVADLPWAEVSAMELERTGPSYTSDTLRALSARFPNDRLYLLMGTDMFLSLPSWHEPEVICALAVIVLCVRDAVKEENLPEVQKQKIFLEQNFGAHVEIPETRYLDLSSTMVRRMLGLRCLGQELPPQVLAFIRERGLYGVNRDLRGLPFDELSRTSLALHKPKRAIHARGVCQTAVELARRFGEDETVAARAGILHDVTKALNREEQLRLCKKYGIMTDEFEQTNYKPLHAKTGAAVARDLFGENEAVCSAIYWHTTGRANMSPMEKILYLADYTEPSRDFEGVDALRALAFQDLDAAMLHGLELHIAELEAENKPLWPQTNEARNWFLSRKDREE